jgi:ketosteroid isomerase-like protein
VAGSPPSTRFWARSLLSEKEDHEIAQNHKEGRTHMLYSYVVKKLIRQSFENVNNHNYDELLKAVAPNVHHRFAGAHSIGGERHDKEAMRRWLERVGRVLPNLHIKINDIWVKGAPWHTKVFVQWDATATLLNGDSSYFNRGFHVITMRWGKVYSLDVFEDSQEVARGLAIQAESGLKEAVAEQIVS